MPTTTYTLRVEGMHCGSCAVLIDDALEDVPGVRSTQTSVKTGRSIVEAESACGPDEIIAAIQELGYTAQQA